MNKVININLGGRLIPMNETAYELLNNYLADLKKYFSREEGGEEIMHDMEDRIGELLQEQIKRGTVAISDKEVEEIKSLMGSPAQIADETGADEKQDESQKSTAGKEQKQSSERESSNARQEEKRMHRSQNEKVLGGVCGGLAEYFNVDPSIMRVIFAVITLFWGTGLLIYILLWIILPEEETPVKTFKRRLYRNEDKRIIGGVCSGIASYFNVDTVWIRLIFLIPVIIGIGSGFIHEILYFSLGGFPAMVLLYIILWIALPKASTVTEKLEMQGKKVDVKNISEAVKNPPHADKSNNSGCLNVFIIFLKIIFGMIGAFVLLILLAIAAGLISALLGVGFASAPAMPFSGLLLGSSAEKTILWISLALVVFVPLFLLIYLFARLIFGRKIGLARWWSVTLIILFIAGVFGLFALAGSVFKDFRSHYSDTKPLTLQPINSDTLLISESPSSAFFKNNHNLWDDDWHIHGDVRIRFQKSTDSLFHATLEKSARGASEAQAMTNAEKISFNFQQNGNQLLFPKFLDIRHSLPFRNQKVTVTLFIPQGKWLYIGDMDDDHWNRTIIIRGRNHISIHTTDDEEYHDHTYYRMNADGQLQATVRLHHHDDDDDTTYYY